jgi:hypothetical protein
MSRIRSVEGLGNTAIFCPAPSLPGYSLGWLKKVKKGKEVSCLLVAPLKFGFAGTSDDETGRARR